MPSRIIAWCFKNIFWVDYLVQKYCWLLTKLIMSNECAKILLTIGKSQYTCKSNACYAVSYVKRIILCWTFILPRNQPLTAAALLKGGADGNRLNKNKCSPLHVAVNKGYKEVVKTFLNSSCNVNAQVCTCILHIFVYVWCFSIRLNKIKWIRNIWTFVHL